MTTTTIDIEPSSRAVLTYGVGAHSLQVKPIVN
jgi:hypothetical protein